MLLIYTFEFVKISCLVQAKAGTARLTEMSLFELKYDDFLFNCKD